MTSMRKKDREQLLDDIEACCITLRENSCELASVDWAQAIEDSLKRSYDYIRTHLMLIGTEDGFVTESGRRVWACDPEKNNPCRKATEGKGICHLDGGLCYLTIRKEFRLIQKEET